MNKKEYKKFKKNLKNTKRTIKSILPLLLFTSYIRFVNDRLGFYDFRYLEIMEWGIPDP